MIRSKGTKWAKAMKHLRIFGILIAVLLTLNLCACSNDVHEIQADENTFLVSFHVNCAAKLSALHFEYSLDGKPVGGGMVGNANGSAMAAEDVFVKDFIPEDFPANADLSQFQLEIYVIDSDENEYPCGEILNIAAEYGTIYDLSIIGNCEDGFSVILCEETGGEV